MIVMEMLQNRFGNDFRHIMKLILNFSTLSKFYKVSLYCDHMTHPFQIVGENATKSGGSGSRPGVTLFVHSLVTTLT